MKVYNGDMENLPINEFNYIYDETKGYWTVRTNLRFMSLEQRLKSELKKYEKDKHSYVNIEKKIS